ncbi:MAG: lysophospholipid acyltransferase family protein [Bacteroidales bacterium]|nr:lysophospholipid acyltransferase family protein [Bacteroidales bacterium]
MTEEKKWAGTTSGSNRMHGYLISVLRHIDVRLLYLFSYIFVIPVALVRNPSRKTAWDFYRNHLGYGRLKAAWYVYLNHCKFSQVVIDRFAMYAGKKFKVEVEGMDIFSSLASRDEGFVMMSSHIGNYEIAGYSLVSDTKTINAVVYGYEKQSVTDNRNNMFRKTNIRMIGIREDMSHLFEIDRALAAGDIVSFPSDRYMGATKTITAPFLGQEAKFPMGPFSVATMRGLDAIAVNTMKEGSRSYRIYVTPLEYDKSASRKEQIRQLSAAYIAELEKRVRQYPAQWYNFFDFWS